VEKKTEACPAYEKMLKAARPDGMIGNLTLIKQRPPSEKNDRDFSQIA